MLNIVSKPVVRVALCITAAAVLVGWMNSSGPVTAKEPEDQSLAAFMRKKLDASSKILEGLTTEEDGLIQEGAKALLEMSKAEKWNVIADEEYREFNRDFRSSVKKLNDAAAEKNYDNATLQWIDSIKSCVECHKYVRGTRAKTK